MSKTISALHFGMAALALPFLVAGCSKPAEAPAIASPVAAPTIANVTDVDVTTNVKTALLQDAALKGADINVVTLKGDVRLIGVLDNQSQVDSALKIARAADGVHSIHDELTVRK
jgi:hyperosmotically inducible periplasmic protein